MRLEQKPRVVVIGAGHVGTFHLTKVAANAHAELVGVVDPHPDRRQAAAQRFNVPATADMAAFAGAADAVIIAAPSDAHCSLGQQALQLGWHVLVEKPMATSVAEARLLVQAARSAERILQVGHSERFNPAVAAALPLIERPRYIVAERLGPFTGRSAQVDVVLDLMIHDLEIVAAVVPEELAEVRAVGVPLMTDAVDMVAARLAFTDGTVAQLSAGRVSLEVSRKLRFFTPERYVSIDCMTQEVKAVRRVAAAAGEAWPQVCGETVAVGLGDALALQDADFIACIASGRQPRVDGAAGLYALELVEAVKRAMQPHAQLRQAHTRNKGRAAGALSITAQAAPSPSR